MLSSLGLEEAHYILPNSRIGRDLVFWVYGEFRSYVENVSKNPWLYDIREELSTIHDIVFDSLGSNTYGIEFRVDVSRVTITVGEQYIKFSHMFRPYEYPDNAHVMNVMRTIYQYSIMTVIGYEEEVDVANPEESFREVIGDRGLYPLFINMPGFNEGSSFYDFRLLTNHGTEDWELRNLRKYVVDICSGRFDQLSHLQSGEVK